MGKPGLAHFSEPDINMKLILVRFLAVIATLVILLAGLSPIPAIAAQPVKVALGFTSSTGWSIANIAPGDRGTQPVTVTNTGASAARLNIWIENLGGLPGTPPPAFASSTKSRYLKDYLLLGVSANSSGSDLIRKNFLMPCVLSDFPQSDSGPQEVFISSLDAGASVNLTWNWELPGPTTGNEVQGASLSFDIKYELTEIGTPSPTNPPGPPPEPEPSKTPTPTPSPTGSPEPSPSPSPTSSPTRIPEPTSVHVRTIELDVPQATDTSGITDQGEVVGELAATTPDKTFSLSINLGTFVSMSNENRNTPTDFTGIGDTVVEKIVVTNPEIDTLPPFPEGWVPVSQAYDINGVTKGVVHGVKMSTPAELVIYYDENELPPIVDGLACFYFDALKKQWVQLDAPEGFIAEGPQVGAEVDHFTLFIVLARPGGFGKPPARIVIQSLTVNPSRIILSERADATVKVANIGGMPGESYIAVKVDGKVQKIQRVKLSPGESTEFQLTLDPANTGLYLISAGALSGDLVVYALNSSGTEYWWVWLLILVGLLALVLGVLVFLRRPRLLVAAAHNRMIELEVTLAKSRCRISEQGILGDTLAGTTLSKRFSLSIPGGARLSISNENRSEKADLTKLGDLIPVKIEVSIPAIENLPALPEGWIPVSLPYDINGVTNNIKHGISLDKPARLVIRYNEKALPISPSSYTSFHYNFQSGKMQITLTPKLVREIAIFCYDLQKGWVRLDSPQDFIAQGPEVAADMVHFSLVIVLAKVGKDSPSDSPHFLIQ